MEEICPEFPKDASRLKAWIEVGMECGDFTLILQSGENLAKIDLESIHRRKAETLPDKYRFRTGTASRKCTSGRKRVLPGGGKSEPHNEGFCNWKENPDDRQTDTRSICRLS